MSNNLENCFQLNVSNPYGNFINVGSSTNKKENCKEDNSKQLLYMGSSFRPAEYEYTNTFTRSHFTNAETRVVNDQTKVAQFLYPDTSKCRNDGYSCKLNTNISKNKQRIVVQSNYYKPNYLDIFGVYDSYK